MLNNAPFIGFHLFLSHFPMPHQYFLRSSSKSDMIIPWVLEQGRMSSSALGLKFSALPVFSSLILTTIQQNIFYILLIDKKHETYSNLLTVTQLEEPWFKCRSIQFQSLVFNQESTVLCHCSPTGLCTKSLQSILSHFVISGIQWSMETK